jgi:hypothetical protein
MCKAAGLSWDRDDLPGYDSLHLDGKSLEIAWACVPLGGIDPDKEKIDPAFVVAPVPLLAKLAEKLRRHD